MSVLLQRHLGKYIGQLVYHRSDSLSQLRGTGMADSPWHSMEKNKNLEKKAFLRIDNIQKSEHSKIINNLSITRDETTEPKLR